MTERKKFHEDIAGKFSKLSEELIEEHPELCAVTTILTYTSEFRSLPFVVGIAPRPTPQLLCKIASEFCLTTQNLCNDIAEYLKLANQEIDEQPTDPAKNDDPTEESATKSPETPNNGPGTGQTGRSPTAS